MLIRGDDGGTWFLRRPAERADLTWGLSFAFPIDSTLHLHRYAMKPTLLAMPLLCLFGLTHPCGLGAALAQSEGQVTGELKRWRPVTVTFDDGSDWVALVRAAANE